MTKTEHPHHPCGAPKPDTTYPLDSVIPSSALERVVSNVASYEAWGASGDQLRCFANEEVLMELDHYLVCHVLGLAHKRCQDMEGTASQAAVSDVLESKPQVDSLCHGDTADAEAWFEGNLRHRTSAWSFTDEELAQFGFTSCDDCDQDECFSESVIPNCDMECAVRICTDIAVYENATEDEVRKFAMFIVHTKLAHFLADNIAETAMHIRAIKRISNEDAFKQKWEELSALAPTKRDIGDAWYLFAELYSRGVDADFVIGAYAKHVAGQKEKGVHPRFCTTLYEWLGNKADVLLAMSHDHTSDIDF